MAWGTGNELCYFLCNFCPDICSYTFKFRTIVRSFSQHIRRAIVLEYSFQVSGLLARIARKPSQLGAVKEEPYMFGYRTFIVIRSDFNHYEGSVAESLRKFCSRTCQDLEQPVFHRP